MTSMHHIGDKRMDRYHELGQVSQECRSPKLTHLLQICTTMPGMSGLRVRSKLHTH